ncbi:MAG: hypothetical protein LBO66_05560 [Deltaproteobacteria bacterium]|jgi:hypothetical protein|nr:hypothetical protein [Deltaproteobacteria bacterium]
MAKNKKFNNKIAKINARIAAAKTVKEKEKKRLTKEAEDGVKPVARRGPPKDARLSPSAPRKKKARGAMGDRRPSA